MTHTRHLMRAVASNVASCTLAASCALGAGYAWAQSASDFVACKREGRLELITDPSTCAEADLVTWSGLGVMGNAGARGARGPTGTAGDTGPDGASGPAGKTGPRGATTTGPQGDVGLDGPAGHPGIRGARGERGVAGEQGDPGQRGARGEMGPSPYYAPTTQTVADSINYRCAVGQVQLTAASFANGMYADGRLLQIEEYYELFSLYGTTYGGDGETTFAIPDLRNAAPKGLIYGICQYGRFPTPN